MAEDPKPIACFRVYVPPIQSAFSTGGDGSTRFKLDTNPQDKGEVRKLMDVGDGVEMFVTFFYANPMQQG